MDGRGRAKQDARAESDAGGITERRQGAKKTKICHREHRVLRANNILKNTWVIPAPRLRGDKLHGDDGNI